MMTITFERVTSNLTKVELWKTLEYFRLHRVVFYENLVKTGLEFVHYLKDAALYLAKRGGEAVGAVWLNLFQGYSAAAHFAVFPPAWGTSEELSRAFVEFVFDEKRADGSPLVTTLLGMTPKCYTDVIRVAEAAGFRRVCELPDAAVVSGRIYPLTIMICSRKEIQK